MDSTRTKLQKAILIILLALAVVFAVVTGVVRTRKGVAFEGGLLSISREGERTVYSGRAEGQKVTITVYPEGEHRVVELAVGTLIDHTYRVEYLGGTIVNDYGTYDKICVTLNGRALFDGGYNKQAAAPFARFCDANGELDALVAGRGIINGDLWYEYEMLPHQILRFANGPSTAVRGDWLIYALAVFISLIVALGAAFPERLFYWNHFLSVRNPEPTDFYMDCQKVAWVIGTAVVLGLYLWGVTRIVS